MHIAVFTDTWEPQVNGVVTSIKLFTEDLRKRGHEVHIFCPADMHLEESRFVHPLRSFKFKPYPEYRVGLPSPKTYRMVKELRPDVIHVHGPTPIGTLGTLIGRQLGVPVIATYHTRLDQYLTYLPGNSVAAFRKLSRAMVRRWLRFVLGQAELVIVPSRDTERVLRLDGIKTRMVVLPTGIQAKQFKGKRTNQRKPMILHVGRLCRERSVETILKAFALLKHDARLVITSSGPAEEELKQLAKELGIGDKVRFTGYISEAEKLRLYRQANVFVTASATDTQGLVVLEAMAAGTPVVAVNAGGARDYLRHGRNALTVRPGDAKAMAAAMQKLLDDRKLHRKLSAGGLKTAKNTSIEASTARLEELYKQLARPSISAVVLAKNEEKFLPGCLRALRRQTVQPEIIVVYGSSRDRTKAIAKKFADKVVSDNGRGIADARNVGWKAASGEIVAYCDADALPPSDWVENISREMRGAIAVSGPLSTYDGKAANFKVWADFAPRLLAAFRFNNLWGANMAFRRSALEREPFRAKFLEDFEMGRRLCRIGKVKFTNNVRMHVSSRRFKTGFYRTCAKYYIPAAARIMLFNDRKQVGYYNEANE